MRKELNFCRLIFNLILSFTPIKAVSAALQCKKRAQNNHKNHYFIGL